MLLTMHTTAERKEGRWIGKIEITKTQRMQNGRNNKFEGKKGTLRTLERNKRSMTKKEEAELLQAFMCFECHVMRATVSVGTYRVSPYTDWSRESSFVEHSSGCQH
jgi:hypothetical protein